MFLVVKNLKLNYGVVEKGKMIGVIGLNYVGEDK